MRIDGIDLVEGSSIANLTVDSGTSFPSDPNSGELFVRTDSDVELRGLYLYEDGVWSRVSSDVSSADVVNKAGDTMTGPLTLNRSNNDSTSRGHATITRGNGSGTVFTINSENTGANDVSGLTFLSGPTGSGVERVRITSTGGVNIGTGANNPNNRYLFVRSGVGISSNGTVESGKWYHDGTLGYLDSGSVGQAFYTGNAERMRLDASGNLALGGSTAYSRLTVLGPVQSSTIKNTISTFDTAAMAAGTGAGIGFGGYIDSANTTVGHFGLIGARKVNNTSSDTSGYLVFETRANGSNLTERMRLDSDGNLGVGATAPAFIGSYKGVHVHNANASQGAMLRLTNAGTGETTTDGAVISSDAAGVMYAWNYENNSLIFGTNNAEAMRLTAAGNFGVGSDNATYKLHIRQADTNAYTSTSSSAVVPPAVQASATLYIENSANADASGAYVVMRSNNTATSANYSYIGSIATASSVIPAVVFGVRSAANSYTERMRIDSNGNVGIGATAPGVKLDVQGPAAVESRVLSSGAVARFRLLDISGNASISTVSGALLLETGSTERMRIDSTGNVGVGGTPTAKFHVYNTSATNEVPVVRAANSSTSTGLTPSGVRTDGSTPLRFYIGGSEAGQFNTSGQLLVGTTAGVGTTFQTTNSMALTASSGAQYFLMGNQDSLGTNKPAIIRSANASFIFGYGTSWASSTGGTMTDLVSIGSNGNFGVGTNSPTDYTASGYQSIALNGSTGGIIEFMGAGVQSARITGWSNTLSFHTNNVERLRISSTGNVSIGTTANTNAFHVMKSGADAVAVVENQVSGDAKLNINTNGVSTNWILNERATGDFVFGTADTARMRLTYGGRLGLGVAVPNNLVDIQASTNQDFLRVRQTTTAMEVKLGTSSDSGYIDAGNADLAFRRNGVEAMRLNGTNVGIGTVTTTAMLDVNSNTIRLRTARTPASATATGNAGDICWDASYVYVCVATNTWKRTALSTW